MTILLANDHLRLWLDPARGVEWRALEGCRGADWLALVPDCRDAADRCEPYVGPGAERKVEPVDDACTDRCWPGQDPAAPLPAANFHMLPYSNRVRDGRFTFEGEHYQLGHADQHAIHGALRRLPWRVEDQTDVRALCTFDTNDSAAPINWPWPIRARIEYTLDGARLISRMALTNCGDHTMPAGLGWHPYFVRTIDGATPELQLPVAGVFPDETGDRLPDGAPVALPDELDFRVPRALKPDQRIDCCLSGLSGPVHIRWPAAKLALTMHASAFCRFLVLFNPDMPHFAVEPVSNANDAFNLEERDIDAGRQTLQPGETLEATMTLDLDVS